MLHQTRRTFVKSMAIGTTAVAVVRWPPMLEAAGDPVQPPPSRGWSGAPGQARYRIDGIPKVTGAKIYARDFRAADIPGWPRNPAYAYVLRAVHADRAFLGLNLDKLPEALRPKIVIQQQDLWARGVTSPWFDAPAPMLVEKDANPVYLGQPVAFLIFDDVDTYRAAFRLMQFDPSYIRYGAPTIAASGQVLGDPYYYIRFS